MDWVKIFKIMDLVKKTWLAKQTIHKRNYEYITILIEDAGTRARFKSGKQETPYRIQYVRIRDIMKYIKENSDHELVFIWEKSEWQEWQHHLKRK